MAAASDLGEKGVCMKEIETLSELLDNEYIANLGKELGRIIQEKLKKSGIYFRIFTRVKEAASVWHKLEWKKQEYLEKGKKLQDLAGIRIVLYYMDDIPVCKEMLKNTYKVIEEDSHEDIPKANEFNPLRMNYVCHMPEEFVQKFPEALWENYRIDKTFEVQIRTTFSEGWHEVDHDVRYKHKEEWEQNYEFSRELNGIYATLEVCDRSMVNLLERLAYQNYKNMQIEAMVRNKFRLRFENPAISVPLQEFLEKDTELVKKIYRIQRESVIRFFASDFSDGIPLTVDNLIFVCNELCLGRKDLEDRTPMLIREKAGAWKKEQKISINMKKSVDTEFYL